MRIIERARASGLDRVTALLLLAAFALAILHHTDHVLRVDHSGWPFRQQVTPFTFSLLAYPMMLLALFGPARAYWWRWALLAAGTGFTLFAHIAIESPAMQYAMWAYNRSLDPVLVGVTNICGVESPGLGTVAVALGMALNVMAVTATIAMLANGLRRRRG